MKKKCITLIFGIQKIRELKILRKMKIVLFLIAVSVTQALAVDSYAQTTKLNLSVKNGKIVEILDEIENQSDFFFMYDATVINVDQKRSVNCENKTVTKILDDLFQNTGITYKIEDRLIALTSQGKKGTVTNFLQQQKNVSGKVTDSSGVPIPGVTVVIKGTTKGIITDSEGNYSLSGISSNATLLFSFVGMKTQEIRTNGESAINVKMEEENIGIEEVIAIGYGTMKKSDLTGSVQQVDAEKFKLQSTTQITEMLNGTIAGFNSNQGTSAQGGSSSMELRGPTSLTANTTPLVVVDGAIFTGSLRDVNPYDVKTIDILKDASSAAVYGAKAASGVIIITTKKGNTGGPIINVSTKVGVAESNNKRKGLGPDEYIQYRQDYLRQIHPELAYDYYSSPDNLNNFSLEEWRNLTASTLTDNKKEWLRRMGFFDIEVNNYLAGKTTDWYDEVFRKGLRQEYNTSISGGTDVVKYYWSLGHNNNKGIRLGDKYSSVHSRLNLDVKVTDWLNIGLNTQFSDENKSGVPASLNFYSNSPYGQMFDEDGNLERLPHGHTDNPLLDYYRISDYDKGENLFADMHATIKFPLGIKFKTSFQPRYSNSKYYSYTTISKELGGIETSEQPIGSRNDSSVKNWMMDNILTWKKSIGIHNFDVTLLANYEKNQSWASYQSNQNFSPNQELSYHGLQYGDSPVVKDTDTKSSGNAYMGRVNYTLKDRYLVTASVRRDGFSAFGKNNKTAVFPAFALGWVVSEEDFFDISFLDRMKVRLSWGINGNRDIGIYSALATTGSDLWYNGSSTQVGVYSSSLLNDNLRWEKTAAYNVGFDLALLDNKIEFSADVYQMNTTDLLMSRSLPEVTGFESIMSNLGELRNRGLEINLNTVNINNQNFSWNTNLVFSFNRNKIISLFGDYSTYTLRGEECTSDVPDFTNGWFPGQSIDVVWDYNVCGIWQSDEAAEAAVYGLEPGDFKAEEVVKDGVYTDTDDKQFIGNTKPRYHLGLRNDFTFLKNFTASVFIRADLGHIKSYSAALNNGYESDDRCSRNKGPVPYWTSDKPNYEYARLNPTLSSFGGGLMIYKHCSFVRIQDFSLAYSLPSSLTQRLKAKNIQIYGSVRNLATFTDWPGWDPESGMTPMPRTYTFGLNFSIQ